MQPEIGALARQVAAHLDGFTAVHRDHNACLRGPDGQELWLHPMWNHPGRVEIGGHYPPCDETYRLPSHKITVAVARGPQTIAKEITRRLLPAYQHDLKIAHDRIAQTARDHQQRTRHAAALRATIGGCRISDDQRETMIVWYEHGSGGGSIRLHGDGSSAAIELHAAGPELTRRIADAVAADISRATQA